MGKLRNGQKVYKRVYIRARDCLLWKLIDVYKKDHKDDDEGSNGISLSEKLKAIDDTALLFKGTKIDVEAMIPVLQVGPTTKISDWDQMLKYLYDKETEEHLQLDLERALKVLGI